VGGALSKDRTDKWPLRMSAICWTSRVPDVCQVESGNPTWPSGWDGLAVMAELSMQNKNRAKNETFAARWTGRIGFLIVVRCNTLLSNTVSGLGFPLPVTSTACWAPFGTQSFLVFWKKRHRVTAWSVFPQQTPLQSRKSMTKVVIAHNPPTPKDMLNKGFLHNYY
jgi:hypothetical protein